jgi:hypothetical protein
MEQIFMQIWWTYIQGRCVGRENCCVYFRWKGVPMTPEAGFCFVPDGDTEMYDPHNLGESPIAMRLNDASLAPSF